MSSSSANSPQVTEYALGSVFWMKPYNDGLPGDGSPNGHPHVLVVGGRPDQPCTLVYGSTKDTEAAAEATRVTVREQKTGVNANGLTQTTHFYPGVLTNRLYRQLPARAGRIGASLVKLRGQMRLALGIGKGCIGMEGHPSTSWRGRIIQLTPYAEKILKTKYAVVITEPRYSAARNYQVVIPIYAGTGRQPSESIISITEVPWLSLLGEGSELTSALIFIPFTCSIWDEKHLESDTGYVLTDELMTHIDTELCERFELPATDPKEEKQVRPSQAGKRAKRKKRQHRR
jgi:hypothetical protein